jgi:FkbM family methyltransferase
MIFSKIFDIIVIFLIKLLRLNKGSKFSIKIYEKLKPIFIQYKDDKTYLINCPSMLIRWRADTYFEKEPDTIEWIDSFEPKSLFYDIGANIGLYSIYAAKNNIKVFSFEPEAQNYNELNNNIFLNKLSNKISTYNLAFSNSNKLDNLYIPDYKQGSALSNVGKAIDWNKKEFKPEYKQSVIVASIDSFIEYYQLKVPNYIKIDVDGLEARIIEGGTKTLSDEKFKSLLIELNEELDEDMKIINYLNGLGLKFSSKYQSPTTNDKFKSVYNYIFTKNIL